MTWLTEEQLVYLHDELIRATGGSQGLRDKNLLQSALYSPLRTFDSSKLFPTIQQKAARLACGLTQNHPFVDGNKRTALAVLIVLSDLNGLNLKTFDYTDLMNGIATKKYDEKDVQRILS